MNRLITRPLVVLGVSGVALGVAVTPIEVSAAEVADDAVAARLCPAGAELYDADVADDEQTDVGLFTYLSEGIGDAPDVLCTFAIVATDDVTSLAGTSTLRVGGRQVTDAIARTGGASRAVLSPADQDVEAVYSASGSQSTTEVTRVSPATRKAAKKALATATKRAKRAYAKAGRTRAAKKAMKRAIAAAKKTYAAAVAPRTTVIRLPLRLDLTLPLESMPLESLDGLS